MIKRLVLFIFFLLFVSDVYADPAVTGETGSWSHGGTAVITGTDFGSKSPAAPVLWDDGEHASAVGVIYDDVEPYACTDSDYNIAYRDGAYRNMANPHGNGTRYIAGAHEENRVFVSRGSGSNITYGANNGSNVALFKVIGANNTDWYHTYYVAMDPLFPDQDTGDTYRDGSAWSGNFKFTQYEDNGANSIYGGSVNYHNYDHNRYPAYATDRSPLTNALSMSCKESPAATNCVGDADYCYLQSDIIGKWMRHEEMADYTANTGIIRRMGLDDSYTYTTAVTCSSANNQSSGEGGLTIGGYACIQFTAHTLSSWTPDAALWYATWPDAVNEPFALAYNDVLYPRDAIGSVGAGEWGFNSANDRIYVGSDPSGITVEASRTKCGSGNSDPDSFDHGGHDDAWRYFDDIYIDKTFSRVMLGNESTLSACTILEPQPPTAWSTTEITVTVNKGALGEGAYIYVFKDDNTYNTSGYAINEPEAQPEYYVRPSGGSYGAEDGTSYATAWDGFSNINWTYVDDGDGTLYVAGTHREQLVVGAAGESGTPVQIRSCTIANGASDDDAAILLGSQDADGGTISWTQVGATDIYHSGDDSFMEDVGCLFYETSTTPLGATKVDYVDLDANWEFWWDDDDTDDSDGIDNAVYVYLDTGAPDAHATAGLEVCDILGTGSAEEVVRIRDVDYVTVDGLTVKYGNGVGIWVHYNGTGCDNVIVQNCTVSYGGGKLDGAARFGNGISSMGNNTNISFLDNTVTQWYDLGFSIEVGNGGYTVGPVLIDGNTSSYNTIGIGSAAAATNASITGVTISDNTVSYSGAGWPGDAGAGINVQADDGGGVQTATISGNTVSNTTGTGIRVKDDGTYTITGNEVTTSSLNGILIGFGSSVGGDENLANSDNSIYNNNIHNNTECGIQVICDATVDFYYNLVHSNSDDGFEAASADGVINIWNNAFYDNGNANTESQVELKSTSNEGNITVNNNLLYATATTYSLTDSSDSNSYNYNVYYNATGSAQNHLYDGTTPYDCDDFVGWQADVSDDANSFCENPDFVDAATDNFLLDAAAPGIDTGTNVGLTTDYIGTTVPINTDYDIGAYEMAAAHPYYLRADGTANSKEEAVNCDSAASAMSIATHNAESFTAGDTIYLCDDGGVFRDSIEIPSSGADGNPVVYSSASGDSPVVSGFDIEATWTQVTGETGDLIEDNFDDGDIVGWSTAGPTAPAISTTQKYSGTHSVVSTDEWSYFYQAWADTNDVYFRGYVYLDNHPTGNGNILGVYRDATYLGAFQVTSSGSLRYWNQVAGAAYTDATIIPEDTWTLVELYWLLGDGAGGELTVKINGVTTINQTNIDNGPGQVDNFRMGMMQGYGGDGPIYWDNLGFDSTGYLGAVTPNSTVYKKTLAAEPEGDEVQVVLEDSDTWYTLQANVAGVDDSSEFYYDAATDTVYIQCSDDLAPSTHVIEVSVRKYGISECGSPFGDCGDDYTSISDISIRGATEYGIFYNNSDGLEIDNVTVEYCGEKGIYHRNDGAGTNTGLTVTNSTIRYMGTDPTISTSGFGVYAEGVNDAVVKNNTISDIYGSGVHITYQAGQADVTGGEVSYNDISGASNAIYLFHATAAEAHYNLIHDGTGIGIFFGEDSDGGIATYNIIHDLTQLAGAGGFNGIDINNASGGYAYGNTIRTVCGGSIIIDDAANNADNWTFKNNILDAENNTKPDVGNAYTMYIDSDVGTCTADYNLHYYPTGNDAGDALYWIGTSYTPAQWTTFVAAKSQEDNGIGFSTDPLFTNASAGYFTLQNSSPCIDVGTDLGASYDDALHWDAEWTDGVATVDQDDYGTAWEIGAFAHEFSIAGGGGMFRLIIGGGLVKLEDRFHTYTLTGG